MKQRWTTVATGLAAAWLLWTVGLYFFGGPRHRPEAAWFILAAISVAAAATTGAGSQQPRRVLENEAVAMWATLLLALSATSIVYAPAAGLGLLSDDFVLLARSSRELVDPTAWEHFRPLPIFVWKALYPLGGAAALHVLNVVLHGANAWMVGLLSYRLGHTPPVAALAAAMFLFFPAAVEPVAWNSGIFDVAAVFFGLLYIHAVMNNSHVVQVMGLAAFTAAMLSKETAIVLPLIAAALATRARVNLRSVAISAVLAAAYTALRLWSGADATTVLAAGSSMRYAIKEILVRPFATLGVPWTRTELIGSTASRIALGLAPVGVVVALIVSYVVGRHGGLRPMTNIAWVFLGIAPLATLFFVNDDLEGSRYLYLPLAGWCLFIADLVDRIPPLRLRIMSATTLLAAAVLLGTWGIRRHLEPWRESAALRDTLIASGRTALQESNCTRATFEAVPAENRGAQLFRNGFAQALGEQRSNTGAGACRFVWNGTRFDRR
jgi:hypothetical protein